MYNGGPRNRQMSSFPVTLAEETMIRDYVVLDGRPVTHFLREVVLAYIAANPIAKVNDNLSTMRTAPARVKAVGKIAKVNDNLSTMEEVVCEDSQIREEDQPIPITARTRERARTENKKEKEIPIEIRSSLRSEQAAPAEVPEADGWRAVAPLKQTIRLSTGEVVTNMHVFANGWRMEPTDVARILNTPSLKAFKTALLHCFAHSIRSAYRAKWCSVYKKLQNSWRDTPRSDKSFMRAAEYLAVEHCNRGMSSGQFIDAINEMRPKSIRFVTADLVGAMASRIEAWIPPEQREVNKGWTSHMDTQGVQWVTPVGEAPVIVLRTAQDREQFLRANKAK
jgi:hypothetical protein